MKLKKLGLFIILFVIIAAFVVFKFVLSIYKLEQSGMEPEIPNGVIVVVQNVANFVTNDIVIFVSEENTPILYRVVSSPGEEIKFFSELDVKGYSVSLSGDEKILDRLEIIESIIDGNIPENIYILKGDSSDLSYIVHKDDVVGKFIFKI